MKKSFLNVGIAGYGVVGKTRHRFIDQHPRMRVTAVCDQNFSEPFSTAEGLECFSNYHQLLKAPLDVLFVCLPNYLAPEATIAGLEKNLHVFCEKPPGRDVADIAKVIACQRKHPKLKLMYGFNHRYHDSVKEAMKVIKSGELGEIIDMRGVYGKSKIIKFDSDWRTKRKMAGGGILLDQGIHMLDMMRLFAGEFTQVHSFISNDFWKHDVEDNAYILMRTECGKVAMMQSSATQWRHRFQLIISLTRGTIVLSGILSSTKSYGAETITVVYSGEEDGGDPREQSIRFNKDNSWRDEIFDFAESIERDRSIEAGSSLEALKTMQLVYKIYCADKDWKKKWDLTDQVPKDI